jgi:hypothetical protein
VNRYWFALLLVIAICISGIANASTPCRGIDRRLTAQQKIELAPIVLRQLNEKRPERQGLTYVTSVDVLRSFRFQSWTILYVAPDNADEAFLFYSHDPMKSNYVTLDAGSVPFFEEPEIESNIIKMVPGIPVKLAECYAWYFTRGRDI